LYQTLFCPDLRQILNVIYDSTMTRLLITLALALVPTASAVAQPAALARARTLYNSGSYDAAIDAAAAARLDPKVGDAASLVLGRAHLERFRAGGAADDLAAARVSLSAVRIDALSLRDQLDLLIGLGQTLYFADVFGAAADVFDNALGRAAVLGVRDRDKLLEWWATALDRQAQARPADRRGVVYARIVERMEDKLRDDAGSAVANYWLVVGARGTGDLDRAWDAAVAGWVRATLGPSTAELRAELDRVMTEVIIQERARLRPPQERPQAAEMMAAEWQAVTEAWK
jgi:hypothetical protein